jgi:hypothetical protein
MRYAEIADTRARRFGLPSSHPIAVTSIKNEEISSLTLPPDNSIGSMMDEVTRRSLGSVNEGENRPFAHRRFTGCAAAGS